MGKNPWLFTCKQFFVFIYKDSSKRPISSFLTQTLGSVQGFDHDFKSGLPKYVTLLGFDTPRTMFAQVRNLDAGYVIPKLIYSISISISIYWNQFVAQKLNYIVEYHNITLKHLELHLKILHYKNI